VVGNASAGEHGRGSLTRELQCSRRVFKQEEKVTESEAAKVGPLWPFARNADARRGQEREGRGSLEA